jgi:rRNA maturation endonuclease Nob1
MVGERTRAALEREKQLALRAIKELEFDKAMGKISEEDFRDMAGRLRSRASRLIRQLDAGAGYRARIEQDVAKRLGESAVSSRQDAAGSEPRPAARACASCSTSNDVDARFCKGCGARL